MLVHWRKVMLGEFRLRALVESMALCSKGQRVPFLKIFFWTWKCCSRPIELWTTLIVVMFHREIVLRVITKQFRDGQEIPHLCQRIGIGIVSTYKILRIWRYVLSILKRKWQKPSDGHLLSIYRFLWSKSWDFELHLVYRWGHILCEWSFNRPKIRK